MAAAAAAAAVSAVQIAPDTYNFLQRNFNGSNVDREVAIRGIVDHLQAVYPKYNVMVCHPQHLANLNNIVFQTHMELKTGWWGTLGIEIYVFGDGVFTLLGDGGYINWCFSGLFTRDAKNPKKVTFRKH